MDKILSTCNQGIELQHRPYPLYRPCCACSLLLLAQLQVQAKLNDNVLVPPLGLGLDWSWFSAFGLCFSFKGRDN